MEVQNTLVEGVITRIGKHEENLLKFTGRVTNRPEEYRLIKYMEISDSLV